MNLTTFRLRIQSTTGLAAAIAGHSEQALVDGWVNEGIVQFLLRTKAVKKTASLTLTVGQGDYTIDPDILALEDLSIGERMLSVVDTGDIRRWRLNGAESPRATPQVRLRGRRCSCSTRRRRRQGTLHIVYVQRPTPHDRRRARSLGCSLRQRSPPSTTR